MTKVKICGITNLDDALFVAKFKADFLGFNFYRESPRFINPTAAKRIIVKIPRKVKKVGVFVNEKIGDVKSIADYCKLDLLQFSGDETEDYLKYFKKYKTIKAIKLQDEKSLPQIRKLKTTFVMIDSFSENQYGGTGQMADWKLAAQAKKFGKKLFLAGGLTPENVRHAIKIVKPFAVDVASGVESIAGKKSEDKVKRFIKEAKR